MASSMEIAPIALRASKSAGDDDGVLAVQFSMFYIFKEYIRIIEQLRSVSVFSEGKSGALWILMSAK